MLLYARFALLALPLLFACHSLEYTCDVVDQRGGDRPSAPGSTIVVLALDGFSHDLQDRFDTPGLDRLETIGVRAERLVPVFPTETAPNFTSLVTGVHPESHGILGNTFLDRQDDRVFRDGMHASHSPGTRWNMVEPLWKTLHRAGLRTASLDWPRADRTPDETQPAVDCTSWPWARERWMVDALARFLDEPADRRPELALLYLPDVDAAAHSHGVEGPALRRAVRSVDGVVQALLDEIDTSNGRAHLVVVSDHGFVARTDTPPVFLDEFLDLSSYRLVTSGAYSALWLRGDAPADAGSDLERLREADLPVRVIERDSIPTELHYGSSPRAPDFLVLAAEGEIVGTRAGLQDDHRALHGYAPSVADMSGVLLAAGPRIRRGSRIPSASVVDVHALVLELLGVGIDRPSDGTLAPFAPVLCRKACGGERVQAVEQGA